MISRLHGEELFNSTRLPHPHSGGILLLNSISFLFLGGGGGGGENLPPQVLFDTAQKLLGVGG